MAVVPIQDLIEKQKEVVSSLQDRLLNASRGTAVRGQETKDLAEALGVCVNDLETFNRL